MSVHCIRGPGPQRLEHGFLGGEASGQVLHAPTFAGAAGQLDGRKQVGSSARMLAEEPCEAGHADEVHPDGYFAAGVLTN
jgi:hypothetical protein